VHGTLRYPKLPEHVAKVASAVGGFTTFCRALTDTTLAETLREDGPFTIFAPTDAAFARLPAGALDALLGDVERRTATLAYCVVTGRLTLPNILKTPGSTPPSLGGLPLTIRIRDGRVLVDDAMIVRSDIACSNGVIHGIDSVLTPVRSTAAALTSSGR